MKIKQTYHKKKCRSCRFFVEHANNKSIGWCHKNAPLPILRDIIRKTDPQFYAIAVDAPTVIACFWCSEHELDKSKSG